MRADLRGMLRTTFRHRCPSCGTGPLFVKGYTLHPECRECGLDLEGQHGAHYGGPIILGYTVAGLSGLGVFALLYWQVGYAPWITWAAVGAVVSAVLVTFRHVKAHWTWWLFVAGELRRGPERSAGPRD